MWNRAQLKEKAKYALKLNYWKIVLVSLLVTIILGGSTELEYNFGEDQETNSGIWNDIYGDEIDPGYNFGDAFQDGFDAGYNGALNGDDLEKIYGDLFAQMGIGSLEELQSSIALVLGILFFVVVPLVLIIALLWSAFVAGPIDVGTKRFFFKSLNEQAEVKECLYAFDSNYKNIAKIMFFMNLYEMLWSFLFIIPGIIKAYEYRMIPYLLAENPNLSKEQVFALSKQMMDGNKWNAFVLDLSFLGWEILSSFSFGLLGIFYVNPYRYLTQATLYEELSLQYGRPAQPEPSYTKEAYTAPTIDLYAAEEVETPDYAKEAEKEVSISSPLHEEDRNRGAEELDDSMFED